MSLIDTAPALAGFIEQLVATEQRSALLELFANSVELRDRSTLLELIDTVNRLARVDLSQAERLAGAVSCLADFLDDNHCRAKARRAVGNVQVLRGQYIRALEIFQDSLELFRVLGDEPEEAATLSSSLQPLIYLGRYLDAFERAQQAQNIAERHHDELLLARLEINFGNIFHRQDRFAEAVHHYECALATLERLGQFRDCAVACVNLAVCYISSNDFRQAELAYQKARSISERENMPMLVAQADYNIAYLHYHRGEHNLAIQLYQQTRKYCAKVADHYHGALCDLDQAELYLELHLSREGEQLAQEAFNSFTKMNMRYEAAKALVFLGVAAYQDRKSFRALELLTAAQERMKQEENFAWVAIIDFYQALIFQQEGRYYEALRSCKAAQSFYSTFPDSGKWVLIQALRAGLHVDTGDITEAETWSAKAVISAERLNSAPLSTHVYWIRGRVEESRSEEPREPCDWYRKSLQFLEAMASRMRAEELKIPFRKKRLELYESLISLSQTTNTATNSEDVFALIEKAKLRDLAEQISFRSVTLPASTKGRSALAGQVQALREELSWYYRRIEDIDLRIADAAATQAQEVRSMIRKREESLAKTLNELHVTDEEFHALQTATTFPLDRIRGAVSAGEIILEYYQARGSIYACVLRRDSLHIEPVTTAERVRDLLRSLEAQFSKLSLDDAGVSRVSHARSQGVLAALTALHAELIAPIRSHLKTDRLIIVPDGPLNYLPFHAFFDGSRYLAEDYVISYAGSATAYCFALVKGRGPHDHDLILGADPDIPADASAVQRIGAVLPRSRVFVDGNVSAETLGKHGPGSRFIHIETCLQARRDNGIFSTLCLGDDQLSILDTFNLQLPCSLISLSGTGPGLRASGNGEEMNLLARGLQYSGAPTVLMPLWNVAGGPQARFLETFYKIADSESDKALALQKTMSEIRALYPSPYYWAPFLLRGATGRTHSNEVIRPS